MTDHNDPRKWGWKPSDDWWGPREESKRYAREHADRVQKFLESLDRLPKPAIGQTPSTAPNDYYAGKEIRQITPKPARKPRKKASLPEPPAGEPVTHVKRFTTYDIYWMKRMGVKWEGEEEMNEALEQAN